jgi:hypothetical protein
LETNKALNKQKRLEKLAMERAGEKESTDSSNADEVKLNKNKVT